MAHLPPKSTSGRVSGGFCTLDKIYRHLVEFYASAGRDEEFVKKLYRPGVVQYYRSTAQNGQTVPCRNIIVTSNYNKLPRFCDLAFIKKHRVFILVMYLDTIEAYNQGVTDSTTKRRTTLTSSSSINYAELFYKHHIERGADPATERQTFFSEVIGVPHTIIRFLEKYTNKQYFNILDMTSKKRLRDSIKMFFKCLSVMSSKISTKK